jgi:hypothetical protein
MRGEATTGLATRKASTTAEREGGSAVETERIEARVGHHGHAAGVALGAALELEHPEARHAVDRVGGRRGPRAAPALGAHEAEVVHVVEREHRRGRTLDEAQRSALLQRDAHLPRDVATEAGRCIRADEVLGEHFGALSGHARLGGGDVGLRLRRRGGCPVVRDRGGRE